MTRTLSLKELRYPITSIIIKRSVIFNHISAINYYTFIVPKDVMKIADKIVVLNQGKIVGQGTHQELMKNNEYYIDLQTNNYSSSHKMMREDSIIEEYNSEQK